VSTVLLLPLQSAALREMLILARALREDGRYRPVLVLREERKYAGAPVDLGEIEYVRWTDRGTHLTPGGAWGAPAGRAAGPSASAAPPRRSWKSRLRRLLSRVFADGLPVALIEYAALTRLLRREISRAEEICAALDPVAVLLSGDRNIFLEPSLMRAARDRGLLTVVVPFAYSGADDVAYMRRDQPLNRVDAGPQRALKRWIARRWPRQVYNSPYGAFLFFTPAVTLALARLGLLPPNPWAMGGGLSDRLAVSGEDDRDWAVRMGVVPEKIVVTGEASHDLLHAAGKRRPALRARLAAERGIPADQPLIVCAVPQLAEHGIMTWDRHWEEIRFLAKAQVASGAAVLLSLHPKSDPAAYRFLEEETGARLLDEPLRDVLAAADVFVGTYSSTVRWAVLLAIPTVVVDFYGFDYDIYDHFPGVVKVTDKTALEPVLRRLVQSPDDARALREGQRRAAGRVAPFDGRACHRLIDLVAAHHGGSSACLSA
jgi:hypothetical protein